jgi:hypothetical protein
MKHRIWKHWAERRSVASTEWAIKQFLSIRDPIKAAETALFMEKSGGDAMKRFLWLCEGYRTNPGMWRAQERAWLRKRDADREAMKHFIRLAA